MQRPASMGATVTAREAAATRIKNPVRTTPHAKAWAKLMARVGEEFPLECPACGGLGIPAPTGTVGTSQPVARARTRLIERKTVAEVPLNGPSVGKKVIVGVNAYIPKK